MGVARYTLKLNERVERFLNNRVEMKEKKWKAKRGKAKKIKENKHMLNMSCSNPEFLE